MEFNGTNLETLVRQGNVLNREIFIGRKAIAIQTLTIDSTVGGDALTFPSAAQLAKITIEKNSLTTGVAARYWEDGTAPTATTGMPLWDGDTVEISNGQNISAFRIISADAAHNQTINVTYYM